MRPTATKPQSKAPKATKPAENPKKRDVDAKMIVETLNALGAAASDEDNGRGFALVTIRKNIEKTYGLKMGKARQEIVKSVMEDEFLKGNIKMTNHDDDKINFTKRFDLQSDDESGAEESDDE